VSKIVFGCCFEKQSDVLWVKAVQIPKHLCKGVDIMYLWLYFFQFASVIEGDSNSQVVRGESSSGFPTSMV